MKRLAIFLASVTAGIAIGYVFNTYFHTAWLFYIPPWDDPLFRLALAAGAAASATGALLLRAAARAEAAMLLVCGLMVVAECATALWLDFTELPECRHVAPNALMPGCP